MTGKDVFGLYLMPSRLQEERLRGVEYISVKEASLILGKSEGRIRKMISEGDLKADKIKNKWEIYAEDILFRLSSFKRLIQESTIKESKAVDGAWRIWFHNTLFIDFVWEEERSAENGRLVKIHYIKLNGAKVSAKHTDPMVSIGIFYNKGIPTRFVVSERWNITNRFDNYPNDVISPKWAYLSWYLFNRYFFRDDLYAKSSYREEQT